MAYRQLQADVRELQRTYMSRGRVHRLEPAVAAECRKGVEGRTSDELMRVQRELLARLGIRRPAK